MRKPTSEKNQSEIAYEVLRQKLLNREFAPGARVRYGPLGDEIGMSATPVREAIGRLASEGLIELVPQLGAVVKRPTLTDTTELYEMREAIEPYAAAKASQLIAARQLKSLQTTVNTMKKLHDSMIAGKKRGQDIAARFDKSDLKFHQTIMNAVNNQRMLTVIGDFHLLTEIIGAARHSYSQEVLKMTIDDHTAILKGLNRRNAEQTSKAMLAHIQNSRRLTLSRLQDECSK
ncbi:GntR family transcriptional regulator [Gimesia algae]|uniref:Putative HTH-type transcriptional regulator YdfH n=1 Tax=Gimesia algae TaxID=2527971 RepID=A0A517VMK6_9PLAN|nr:GntR family transcriptional regulator [Gimesia algae]QDT94251.1 putative HTH-type transcriptional regulator YdfH [Gimesia algae]